MDQISNETIYLNLTNKSLHLCFMISKSSMNSPHKENKSSSKSVKVSLSNIQIRCDVTTSRLCTIKNVGLQRKQRVHLKFIADKMQSTRSNITSSLDVGQSLVTGLLPFGLNTFRSIIPTLFNTLFGLKPFGLIANLFNIHLGQLLTNSGLDQMAIIYHVTYLFFQAASVPCL